MGSSAILIKPATKVPTQIDQLWFAFRCKLIALLAGKKTIVINARLINGTLETQGYEHFIYHCYVEVI